MSNVEYILGRLRGRYTSCHFHLILSYHKNTHSIFPNLWSQSLFPRSDGFTQWHGSSRLGSIISSHLLPTLFELELLSLTNSVRRSPEVDRNVDGGLSAFKLRRFTTTASKWCISRFSQWASPGAPPIMLDYHLWPD